MNVVSRPAAVVKGGARWGMLDDVEGPKEQPTADPPRSRMFWVMCAVVFALALGVRLWHVHQIRAIPLFYELIGDAESYDQWGQRIAGGEWIGKDVFYQAPLYPYLLGVIYKLGGHDLLGTRLIQCLMGAGACVVLAMAGREWFCARVGVIAGLVLAVYPSAIFFDAIIQKSVLDLVLMCALLYFIGAATNRATTGRWVGIGVTLGALMLTRENAGVLVIVVLGWALWFTRGPARLSAIGVMLAAIGVVVLPVAMRNAMVSGEFHITTSQLGPNLFIGNNPEANGAYVPLVYGHGSPQYERADATMLAERAVGRKLSPGEVSRYWVGRVLGFIYDRPGAWLELMRTKFILFWNATELGDTEDQYVYADWSSVLRLLNPFLHFGVLCAFAAVGFGLTIERWRKLWVLYAIILAYAASVIAFYVMARYRFPIVPALMLFAAAGLVEAWEWMRGRRNIEAWLGLLMIFAGGFVLRATQPIDNKMVRAATYQSIAHVLDRQNKLDLAFDYYRRARDLWPEDALLNVMLGRILLDQEKPTEALDYFQQAVRLAPSDAASHIAFGAGLLQLGRLDEAREQFEQAVSIDPQNERAAEGLKQVRLRKSKDGFSL